MSASLRITRKELDLILNVAKIDAFNIVRVRPRSGREMFRISLADDTQEGEFAREEGSIVCYRKGTKWFSVVCAQ
jgi:hypothetical protein